VLRTSSNNTKTAIANSSRKLTTTSSDGKWETYVNFAAGIMRYVPDGRYYARAKMPGRNGKAQSRSVTSIPLAPPEDFCQTVWLVRAPDIGFKHGNRVHSNAGE